MTPPPKASGIDYLALVSQRLAAQERARLGIAYVKLSDPQSAHAEEENS